MSLSGSRGGMNAVQAGLRPGAVCLHAVTLIPALLSLAAPLSREEPNPLARELVEKLRSKSVKEREEATRTPKSLGKAALPELEKAARESDAECAARARRLIRVLDLTSKLSPALREALPGVEDRLATGDGSARTQVFL